MNEGWLCPRCKRVNAPWVSSCPCHEISESRLNLYASTADFDWDKTQFATARTISTPENVTTTNTQKSE